jgi:hypothetical protein
LAWLEDFQRGFREPAAVLLTQFWWVIPLALLGFWLYFVLEIEPQRRRQSAGDGPDGADDDGDGGDGGD